MTGTDVDRKLASAVGGRRRADLQMMVAGLIVVLVVDLLVRTLVDGIFTKNAGEWPYNPAVTRIAGMITSRLVEAAAVLLALAILFRITGRGSFGDLGLRRRGLKWLPGGFVLPILSLVLAAAIAYLAGFLPVNRLLYPGPWPATLAFAASTQAAFVEEVAFRGLFMQGVELFAGGGSRGRGIAIVVSGLLFAAFHVFAPFELTWAWWIVVIAAGLGLGWAFYAAGRNLWLLIGLHWGFDLGLFLLLGLPGESRGLILSRLLGSVPALSQVGGYIMLIGTFLTVLILFLLLRRGWKQESVA